MLFVIHTFFTEKNGEIFKAFLPLFNRLLSFSLRIQQKILNFPTSVMEITPGVAP
jgi:hypothetical protein